MITSCTLLAIDTSTDACSVALGYENQIFEHFEIAKQMQSRRLLAMVDDLLKQHHHSLPDLDLLAFGCGPGSFTGVRIACSVIQGFAFATNKKAVAVSTLRAIAQGVYREQGKETVLSWLDARMGEFYWGTFAADPAGIMQPLTEEKLDVKEKVICPAGMYETTGMPHAQDIVKIAMSEKARAVNSKEIVPVYIRNKVANIMKPPPQ